MIKKGSFMSNIQNFDLVDHIKTQKKIEFESIELREFEDSHDAQAELNEAEQTLFKYKQMYEHLQRADEITDSITCGQVQFDHMSEHDEIDLYGGESAMDTIHATRLHVRNQIAKFKEYCENLEGTVEDFNNQERNESTYGDYDAQVRAEFYATR